MYTHRISGVAHGVKRHCYLFWIGCSERGLALKTHSLISPRLSYRDGDGRQCSRKRKYERHQNGQMDADPRRLALWLSLSLGWVT
jgi:hypothetical protein